MLRAEELQELAQFWSEEKDAVSLYFQAPAPTQPASDADSVPYPEQIRDKLLSAARKDGADSADIERMIDAVTEMQATDRRARVIFACGREKLWRAYDIPGDFGTHLDVGPAFTIAPLIAQQMGRHRYAIALADRNKARLLLLEAREITEHSQVLDEDKEKIRTTGARQSAHRERKKEEKVRQHFSFLADHLLHFHEHGDFDSLLIGCRDEMWPEIESSLHNELKRVLAGRFSIDPGAATRDEVAARAQPIIDERDRQEEETLVERVQAGAASDRLGAIGLNAVIDAIEKGEVRTLLWSARRSPSEERPASLCANCGHLAPGTPGGCFLCGRKMRTFAHAEEALLRHLWGRSIEVRMLTYAKLPTSDGIAARLRFVAEHNTARALAS